MSDAVGVCMLFVFAFLVLPMTLMRVHVSLLSRRSLKEVLFSGVFFDAPGVNDPVLRFHDFVEVFGGLMFLLAAATLTYGLDVIVRLLAGESLFKMVRQVPLTQTPSQHVALTRVRRVCPMPYVARCHPNPQFPALRITVASCKIVGNIMIKMFFMPLGVGYLLGTTTVDLFGTTIADRWEFVVNNPFSSCVTYWMMGLTFSLITSAVLLQVGTRPSVLTVRA